MSALRPEVRALLDGVRVGALATAGGQGRPRQSIVYFALDGDRVLVSTDTARWKAGDVRRTGWASLCVHGDRPPYPSATLAGPARILSDGIGPGTARVMQRITGSDEPPEPQSDEALAAVGRVLLVIDVERVGPVSHLEAAGDRGA